MNQEFYKKNKMRYRSTERVRNNGKETEFRIENN